MHEWVAGLGISAQNPWPKPYFFHFFCVCLVNYSFMNFSNVKLNVRSVSFVSCFILTWNIFRFRFLFGPSFNGQQKMRQTFWLARKWIPFERWTKKQKIIHHIFCLKVWQKEHKSFMSWMRATFFGGTRLCSWSFDFVEKYKDEATAVVAAAAAAIYRLPQVSCCGWLFLMYDRRKRSQSLRICYHITFIYVSMVIESWCVSI